MPFFLARLIKHASLLLAIALTSFPLFSWAESIVVEEAQVSTTLAGETRASQQTRLPFDWGKNIGRVDGRARFVMHIPVANTTEPLAIYVPRIGNTFVIKVNGHELARYGSTPPGPYEDAANQPRYYNIPTEWLTPHTQLEVAIAVNGGRRGGLSTITIGPPDEIYKLFARYEFLHIDVRLVLVVLAATTGVLGLLWWVRQRNITYLYYALGELLWALLNARQLFSPAPLPWPMWGHAMQLTFALAVPLQCKFALTVIDRDRGWVGKLVNFMIIGAIPAVIVAANIDSSFVVELWVGLIIFTVIAMSCTVISILSRDSSLEMKILGFAVVLVVVGAVRDVIVLPNSYLAVSWSRFTWTGFGIGFVWIIAERMRRATDALSMMSTSLSTQLAVRDAELTAAFARERVLDVERGALLERQRLMRDLHDGLGSHLVGALRMAQQVSASKEEITSQLRMAVDQLKITVDAMQDVEGDIPSLLGAIRHRLSPRLQAAGISLKWNVDHLPTVQHWGVRQSYDLQMILFEAFTNIVAHSGANCVTLSARNDVQQDSSIITIEICDNGKGINLDSSNPPAGKGMASMLTRAKALGAVMSIRSEINGTCIVLALTGTCALS